MLNYCSDGSHRLLIVHILKKKKKKILPNTLNTTSPQKITLTSNIISYTQLEVIDMTQVGQGSADID